MALVPATSHGSGSLPTGDVVWSPTSLTLHTTNGIDILDDSANGIQIQEADATADGFMTLGCHNANFYVADEGGPSFFDGGTHGVQVSPGSGELFGLFGTTPAARPVVPLTLPTAQNIIDALVALGAIAQHD